MFGALRKSPVCWLDFTVDNKPGVTQLSTLGSILISLNDMKTTLMLVLGSAVIFVSGCTSSHTQAGNSGTADSKSAVATSSVYDPATDTTTFTKDGFTWRLKGNSTNLMVEARPK
jgi:hypothetical protein